MKFERDDRNLGGRAIKSATFLAGGRLIVRLFSLINLVVLARLLAPSDYGVAALAITAIGFFQAFSDLKASAALVALDDISPTHLNTAFTIEVVRGLIISVGLFALSGPVAIFMEEPALVPVLKVLSVILIFDALKNPAFALYARNVDYSKEFLRDTASMAISSIAAVAAAFYFRSYWAIIAGTIVQRGMSAALTYYGIPFRPRLGLSHWRAFFGFGSWLTLRGMVLQLNEMATRVMVGKFVGAGPLGILTVATQVARLATSELMAPLARVLFPAFSAIKHDPSRLRKSYRDAQTILVGIALPVSIGIVLFSKEILLILFGAQWLEADLPLRLLAPIFGLGMVLVGVNGLAMALNKVRAMFIRSVFGLFTIYPAIYIGIQLDGFQGAVIGYAVFQLAMVGYNLKFASSMLDDHLLAPFAASWRSFLAGGAMALSLLWLPREFDSSRSSVEQLITFLPYVAVGGIVYVTTHFLLWKLSGEPEGFEENVLHYTRVAKTKLVKRNARNRT